MTKKLLITLSILTLFASCGTRRTAVQIQDPTTFDEGVVINGIRWATRNVDMPGTFAETPESFGMLFQWNRRKVWNAVDRYVEGWDNTPTEGTTWYAENDPCPEGWRVPTIEEFGTLENIESEWTTRNDVYGRYFGTYPTVLFMPAVRIRHPYDSALLSAITTNSWFWSSSLGNADRAWGFWFSHRSIDAFDGHRAGGLPIRCVAK